MKKNLLYLLLFLTVCSCQALPKPKELPTDTERDGGESIREAQVNEQNRRKERDREACAKREQKLQTFLDQKRTSPNAILVIKDQACGTKVYVSGDPKNADRFSLWRVGSVTKTYIAAAVLIFVKRKKLSLDDLISKWFPEYQKLKGINVRMLLNHTSGIFEYTSEPSFLQNISQSWSPKKIIDLAMKHPLDFAPGKGWNYSNTNYILLGLILEKLGGAKLGAVLRKYVLKPGGFQNTFLEGEERLSGSLAKGFDKQRKESNNNYSMTVAWAAGAIVATGADLCNWVAELYGGNKILGEFEKKLMLEGAIKASESNKYGLGVILLGETSGIGPGMGHGGGIPGFSTFAYWFPRKKIAICIVVNQDDASPESLMSGAVPLLSK